MSITSNLKLNKHDNVSTNTNPFDIENYLNVNWDKIDKYAGNSNSTILKLQEENARLKKTIQTELEERTIEAESIEVNDSAEANCEIDLQGNTTQEASPNPDYPSKVETVTGSVEVKIRNKNLFTTANQILAYIGGSSFVLSDSSTSNDNYTAIIPIKPNTSYTISRSIISSRFRVGFYSTKNALGKTLRNGRTSDSATNMTVTSGENDYYLYLYYWTKNDTTSAEEIASTIQIEKGSQATDFIPHKQQTYPLYLPFELCKIGDYKDYIFKKNDKWYKHKEIEKLTGNDIISTLAFTNSTLYSDSTYLCCYNNGFQSTKYLNTIAYCNKFNGQYHYVKNKVANSLRMSDTSLGICVLKSDFATVNDLNSYFNTNGNDIFVYMVLATPIDEEITDTTLIQQLNELENTMSYYGTTYVDTTNEVIKPILKFTYNRSNRLRIENLEKAIINS